MTVAEIGKGHDAPTFGLKFENLDGAVSCADPQPTCPQGQVSSVVNDCYGPCVAVSQCRCLYHWMCPELAVNTCLIGQYRCGPNPNLVDAGSDGGPDAP